MNKKEEKVKRLWNKGTKDLTILAKRLGYSGNSLTAGIEKVREIIHINKLK